MKSFVILLLLASMVIAGCGAPAAAQSPQRAAQPEEYPVVEAVNRPGIAIAPPAFHRPDALRILPSRIVIPSIKVDTPVVELGWSTKKTAAGAIFSEWDVAAYAAGWHKNSALPAEDGNVVMSGHNNILGSVFRELDRLKRGDTITVYSGKRAIAYTVDEVLIVPERHASLEQRKANARYIEPTKNERLTLVSCWPRNDNSHRIIVIATPVQEMPTAQKP
ncbi:MAG: sortase [Caldilineaceae bacterium]|nr:sortase [Caldilineaceae bacterium]